MRIPESVRLWWYDGPGVRVIRYSARQWGVYVLVCVVVVAATFVPTQHSLALALHVVVTVFVAPAGLVRPGLLPRCSCAYQALPSWPALSATTARSGYGRTAPAGAGTRS